jgi:hypothetical protein
MTMRQRAQLPNPTSENGGFISLLVTRTCALVTPSVWRAGAGAGDGDWSCQFPTGHMYHYAARNAHSITLMRHLSVELGPCGEGTGNALELPMLLTFTNSPDM